MAELDVKAVSRYVRISPRKVQILIGTVKGQPVQKGLYILKFMPQKAAAIVEKIVRSAVANAEQRAGVNVDTLVIKNITADQGPSLKRFSARARGRGTQIIKRTSHITVTLAEKSF
jgi:large subunit ribosomal protein L22